MTPCPDVFPAPSTPPGPYFVDFVEGRRGEILDAALFVFSEKGYESGTMREIASRVGVTEPALYRHYPSKEALLEDLVAVAGGQVVGRVGAIIDELDPASLRAGLVMLAQARRRRACDNTKPIMRMLLTAAPHNRAFREAFRAHVALPLFDRLAQSLPRIDAYYGIARTPEETRASLRIFMSLFVGYFMTGALLEQPDDDDAIAAAMMAVMGWTDSPR